MNRTGVAAVLAGLLTESITCCGNFLIEPTPQRERPGDVQQRHHRPECSNPTGQIPKRRRTTVLSSVNIDNPHFFHHLVVRQIRSHLGHLRVVKRQKRQPPAPIESIENTHPSGADSAVTIVDDDIGLWTIFRTRKAFLFSRRLGLCLGAHDLPYMGRLKGRTQESTSGANSSHPT